MSRLTHQRNNGIKEGYWSPNKKEELVERLAKFEDAKEKMRPSDGWREDKAAIVNALLPLLRMTRNLYDLVDLKYVMEDDREHVIATFSSGYTKTANVSMDSGTSMIRDIIGQIV